MHLHNRKRTITIFMFNRTVKFFVTINAELFRPTAMGVQRTDATFRTDVVQTSSDFDADIASIERQLTAKLDEFNQRGSSWQLHHIKKCIISIAPYRPLVGSSYLRTPDFIANKHATVNIVNRNDNLCFAWYVLAYLHPVKTNPRRLTNYESFIDELNLTDLVFPLALKDIPKFERLNPTIRITVLTHDDDEKTFVPLYVSSHHDRQVHVKLLLISDGDKHHYILIRSMSRLIAGRTSHDGATHVCEYCLHHFTSKNAYDRHVPECSAHTPQRVASCIQMQIAL